MNEEQQQTAVLTVFADGSTTIHPELTVRDVLSLTKAIESQVLDIKPASNGVREQEPIQEQPDAL